MRHLRAGMLVVLAVSACTPPPGKDEPACEPDGQEWFLRCPEQLKVQAGQYLELRVDRVGDPPPKLFVWVDGEHVYRFTAVRPVEGAAGSYLAVIPTPVMSAGKYRFSAGTERAPRSNAVALEVELAPARYTQQQAAELLRDGLHFLASDAYGVYSSADERWTGVRERAFSAARREAVEKWLTGASLAADRVREIYLALSPEHERSVQAFFEGSGLLRTLERWRQGSAGWPRGDLVPLSVTKAFGQVKLPEHRHLLMLDFLSFAIHTGSLGLDVAIVISLVVPGGQPIAGLGAAAKFVVAAVKYVIDTAIPTDLRKVEIHGQKRVFHGEPSTFAYWGTFTPQNDVQGGVRSLDSLIVDAIGELAPGGKLVGIKKAVRELLISFITSLGGSSAYLLQSLQFQLLQIKIPIDYKAYTFPILDFLGEVPGGAISKQLRWLLERLSGPPAGVGTASPDWASGAEVKLGGPSSLTISGIAYPTTSATETATLGLFFMAHRLGEAELWIATLPTIETVPIETWELEAQQKADPADPNQVQSDEAFVHTKVPKNPGGQPLITADSSKDRTYRIGMYHPAGFVGPAEVDVYVGEELKHAALSPPLSLIPQIRTEVPLPLQPGYNTVRIVNKNPNLSKCSTGQVGGEGCLIVIFPDSISVDRSKTIVFSATDGTYTFEAWAPPSF